MSLTTLAWLVATFVSAPTAQATLDSFYRRVHPAGPGWAPVAARHPDVQPEERLGRLFLSWFLGVTLVYATLFGTGYLVVGRPVAGLVTLVIAIAAALLLWFGGGMARTAGDDRADAAHARS